MRDDVDTVTWTSDRAVQWRGTEHTGYSASPPSVRTTLRVARPDWSPPPPPLPDDDAMSAFLCSASVPTGVKPAAPRGGSVRPTNHRTLGARLHACNDISQSATKKNVEQQMQQMGAPSQVGLSIAAAAAAVGLCVSLSLPGAAEAASSVFVGDFADPKHPGCLRAIAGQPPILEVTGTDGTPGCLNGEKQRPWALTGEVVKVPSKEDQILIDFSPKGGPKNLLGKWTGTGILFPDGNEWKKLD